MGDACNFINISDPRFDPYELAEWIYTDPDALANLATAEVDKFIEYVSPIAGQCDAVVKGNHEKKLHKKYEHDVYKAIVAKLCGAAEYPNGYELALGYVGWLVLEFYSCTEATVRRGGGKKQVIKLFLWHGAGGGKLRGGKALTMQRLAWIYGADIIVMGHVHSESVAPEAVIGLDDDYQTVITNKYSVISGTCLNTYSDDEHETYSGEKLYFPIADVDTEIELWPFTPFKRRRVSIKISGW
jgi:predicted phosphodiesterase